jgi:hypothetical protein
MLIVDAAVQTGLSGDAVGATFKPAFPTAHEHRCESMGRKLSAALGARH